MLNLLQFTRVKKRENRTGQEDRLYRIQLLKTTWIDTGQRLRGNSPSRTWTRAIRCLSLRQSRSFKPTQTICDLEQSTMKQLWSSSSSDASLNLIPYPTAQRTTMSQHSRHSWALRAQCCYRTTCKQTLLIQTDSLAWQFQRIRISILIRKTRLKLFKICQYNARQQVKAVIRKQTTKAIVTRGSQSHLISHNYSKKAWTTTAQRKYKQMLGVEEIATSRK